LSLCAHVDARADKPIWDKIPCDQVLDPKWDMGADITEGLSKLLYCKGVRLGLTKDQARWLAEDWYEFRSDEGRALGISHFKLIELCPSLGFDGALKKVREEALATATERASKIEALFSVVEKLSKMEKLSDAPVFSKCELTGHDIVFRRLFYKERVKAGLKPAQAELYTDWVWGFAVKNERVRLLDIPVVDEALGIEELPSERGDGRRKRLMAPSEGAFLKAIRKGADAYLRSLNQELISLKSESDKWRRELAHD
jgi:hypothetical protein